MLLGVNSADARRAALVDVAEQARSTDLTGALEDAGATGAHREHTQERIEGFANGPRVCVGAEVFDAFTFRAAHHLGARELLIQGHREPRVGLVVAIADVEARIELLDPA